MHISGAKFGEHCSNISGDILIQYLVFYNFITFLICIIQKRKYLMIKISKRSFTQRFDDSMSSSSTEKRVKFDSFQHFPRRRF